MSVCVCAWVCVCACMCPLLWMQVHVYNCTWKGLNAHCERSTETEDLKKRRKAHLWQGFQNEAKHGSLSILLVGWCLQSHLLCLSLANSFDCSSLSTTQQTDPLSLCTCLLHSLGPWQMMQCLLDHSQFNMRSNLVLQHNLLNLRFISASAFIHSGYFYSASSSPLLLRGAPDTARILCQSFTPKHHRQLQAKNLPKVPTWWLKRDSNSWPFGR